MNSLNHPDTICELDDLIENLEPVYFRTGCGFKKRLDAAEKKRQRLRGEQIQRGYVHKGFQKPQPV